MEELYSNYASALYGLIDKAKSEEYLAVLQGFCSLLDENPDIKAALCSYSLPKEEKQRLLEICFKGDSLPHLLEFMKVVLGHHRLSHIKGITEAFALLVHEQYGVKEGVVYSAAPLSAADIADMESAFSARLGVRVVLKNRVDEMLLGGVKVALDGKVYDGTLRSRLLELQKQLKKPA